MEESASQQEKEKGCFSFGISRFPIQQHNQLKPG
jgi:hypothetical protein